MEIKSASSVYNGERPAHGGITDSVRRAKAAQYDQPTAQSLPSKLESSYQLLETIS